MAVVIFGSALFAGYESYEKLISDRGTTNLGVGMAAAMVGMAAPAAGVTEDLPQE